jgi:predicted NUDIX family phosphoesterase
VKKALSLLDVDFSNLKNSVAHLGDEIDLAKCSYFLLSRPLCETQIEYRQLIPYITLVNIDTREVYMYKRGQSGDETRLHDLWSLGLGGHIEDEVTEDKAVYDILVDTTAREIEEEVGYIFDNDELNHIYASVKLDSFFINNEVPDVDKVHLGICFSVEVDPRRFGESEENVIVNGQWISLELLKDKVTSGEIELESWSKTVFANLIENT